MVQLSPGVNVSEIDLTTVIPSVAVSTGAIAGLFRWGPVGTRILIDSENKLASTYGAPTSFNAETFFTAANFLSYSNALWVSRAAKVTGQTPSATFTTSPFGAIVNDGSMVVGTTYVIQTIGTTDFTLYGAASNIVGTTFVANNVGVAAVGAGTVAEPLANNIFTTSDTSLFETGMYVTQTSNSAVVGAGESVTITNIVDATRVQLSVTSLSNLPVDLYFGDPETSYTAVGINPDTGGVVANLANQIVINPDVYVYKDGTFDTDVLYVAKYPGELGNSIRVSQCDSADQFSSNVTLPSITNTVTVNDGSLVVGTVYTITFVGTSDFTLVGAATNTIGTVFTATGVGGAGTGTVTTTTSTATTITFNIGVNNAVVVLPGVANPLAATISGYFATNDKILAGNTTIGQQYIGVDSIVTTSNATSTIVTFNLNDNYRLHTNYTTSVINRTWEFADAIGVAPGTSSYVRYQGNTAAKDEMHVVVVDEFGYVSGTPGSILEIFKGVSRAIDSKTLDNTANYYKDVINKSSLYIYSTNDRPGATSAIAKNVASATTTEPANIQFTLGSDGFGEASASLSTIASAYDLFKSKEAVDISLIMTGRSIGGVTSVNGQTVSNFQLANYIIDNIAELRKDVVVFLSPDKSTVINNVGREASTLVNWRGAVRDTSYAVMDSGYKYQYDRYNDVYRWIPMNGDIAGLCARTDDLRDPWWSPAGFNRGQIKNLVKVAFNANKAEADLMYTNGVNPVISFVGQGTVLYGDKTLQSKPSAFDRINVRRLFIVLEKAISLAAKYSLFEFNDDFTRSQFKNLVNPYLRNVKGRRGIQDFIVVCDDTNNTPQIIDTNQFVGDIYIKPARSINFIQLNFVAVPTGVAFSEVIGNF
jgi:hypothetical protein